MYLGLSIVAISYTPPTELYVNRPFYYEIVKQERDINKWVKDQNRFRLFSGTVKNIV